MSVEPERVELTTPNIAEGSKAAFERLFPGVIADGVLDAACLADLLDIEVAAPPSGPERFGLAWSGKQDAIRSLLTPSTASLLPDVETSISFDNARNAFIEGDNLEVLKLLQKAYNDRVKLIYIDPPYNTGNDLIYVDDFSDGLRRYLEYSGLVDADGNRTSAAVEVAGRRHSRWLSMIYPRLVLARNLLTQDGVLLCSINDVELPNLISLMREAFGEENFIATFVWNNSGHIEQQSRIKLNHEYIIAFARNERLVPRPTEIDPNIPDDSKLFREEVENSITKNGPANPQSTVVLPRGFPASGEEFEVDPRDAPFPAILDRIVVRNGQLTEPARLRSGWSSRRLLDLFIENRFVPIEDAEGKATRFALSPTGAIYIYKKRSGTQGHVLSVLRNLGTTQASSSWLKREWGIRFDYPKPERLIQHLVATFTDREDLVVDFFAGSGTTAHAVALLNARDGGARRTISINAAEPASIDAGSSQTVSDVTLARITKVMETVDGNAAHGLRVLRLRASQFHRTASNDRGELFGLRDSTLETGEVSVDAIAAEVLLAEGVPLDSPWERVTVGGADVILADGIAVIVATTISDDIVSGALALNTRVVIFLEDGFAGADAVKANAVTNAKNLGITLKTV